MSNLQKIIVLFIVGGIILVGGFFLLNNNSYLEEVNLQRITGYYFVVFTKKVK